MREKETPQPKNQDHPILINIEQPGTTIHIEGTPLLSELQQGLLKIYTLHTCYNGHKQDPLPPIEQQPEHDIDIIITDKEETEHILDQLEKDIKPTRQPINNQINDDTGPFSQEDIMYRPYSDEMHNSASLFHSVYQQILKDIPDEEFTIHKIAKIIHKFYNKYERPIKKGTSLDYAHCYKRALIINNKIQQVNNDASLTPIFQKTIENKATEEPQETPPTDDVIDPCIDSIRQHIIQHQETNSGFTRGVLVLQLSESFNEEEIDKALAYMIRNHEIYQTSNTSFMPVQPVSRIIQNNTGEKTT